MQVFYKAAKGKDLWLAKQSSSKLLNFPYKNWVETVLLLVSNPRVCCQVLLNTCCITPLCRIKESCAPWAGKVQNKAEHPWQRYMEMVSVFRWWGHSTPLYSKRSSCGSVPLFSHVAPISVHTALGNAVRLTTVSLVIPEHQCSNLLPDDSLLPRSTSTSHNKHCNCLLLSSKASISSQNYRHYNSYLIKLFSNCHN